MNTISTDNETNYFLINSEVKNLSASKSTTIHPSNTLNNGHCTDKI